MVEFKIKNTSNFVETKFLILQKWGRRVGGCKKYNLKNIYKCTIKQIIKCHTTLFRDILSK